MPSRSIIVRPYLGALDPTALLSGPKTIPLAELGPCLDADLLDPEADFGSARTGKARFLHHKVNYIGCGTASAGVMIGGMILPLELPCDIVIFEAGGRIWFHYPDAVPAVIGQVAVILDIADVVIGDPICPSFHSESKIDTPTGPRAVKDLDAGDLVSDATGHPIRLIWTEARKVHLARPMSRAMHRSLAPVRIPAGSLGAESHFADLWVAPDSQVLMSGFATRLLFGLDHAFVPARALIGSLAEQPAGASLVVYHHIRCERPCTLRANGVPVRADPGADVGLRTLAALSTGRPEDRSDPMFRRCTAPQRKTRPHPPVLTELQGRIAGIVAATLA